MARLRLSFSFDNSALLRLGQSSVMRIAALHVLAASSAAFAVVEGSKCKPVFPSTTGVAAASASSISTGKSAKSSGYEAQGSSASSVTDVTSSLASASASSSFSYPSSSPADDGSIASLPSSDEISSYGSSATALDETASTTISSSVYSTASASSSIESDNASSSLSASTSSTSASDSLSSSSSTSDGSTTSSMSSSSSSESSLTSTTSLSSTTSTSDGSSTSSSSFSSASVTLDDSSVFSSTLSESISTSTPYTFNAADYTYYEVTLPVTFTETYDPVVTPTSTEPYQITETPTQTCFIDSSNMDLTFKIATSDTIPLIPKNGRIGILEATDFPVQGTGDQTEEDEEQAAQNQDYFNNLPAFSFQMTTTGSSDYYDLVTTVEGSEIYVALDVGTLEIHTSATSQNDPNGLVTGIFTFSCDGHIEVNYLGTDYTWSVGPDKVNTVLVAGSPSDGEHILLVPTTMPPGYDESYTSDATGTLSRRHPRYAGMPELHRRNSPWTDGQLPRVPSSPANLYSYKRDGARDMESNGCGSGSTAGWIPQLNFGHCYSAPVCYPTDAVKNGGFDTLDSNNNASPWELSNDDTSHKVIYGPSSLATSQPNNAAIYNLDDTGFVGGVYLRQNLTLCPGTTYELTFTLATMDFDATYKNEWGILLRTANRELGAIFLSYSDSTPQGYGPYPFTIPTAPAEGGTGWGANDDWQSIQYDSTGTFAYIQLVFWVVSDDLPPSTPNGKYNLMEAVIFDDVSVYQA
ncbi:hypothetical protein E8E14_000406 [Neopestalotiopsis sp. 37M]|nr:hypothetical protein E8E14_000406 [Neopestalotiopsis sp. 37M]